MIQLELFQETYTDLYNREGFKYSSPPIADITFRGGLSESVHRWFRLTPSYSPELVRFLIGYLDCTSDTLILDPFLGKGTTLIECQKLGYPSVGVELNPLLAEVSRRSLEWRFNLKELEKLKTRVLKQASDTAKRYKDSTFEKFSEQTKITAPPIHNVFRWWKPRVLIDLLILKSAISKIVPNNVKSPFWIALSTSALDCANIHRNHPTISFDDNHTRNIMPLKDFEDKISAILRDLEGAKQARSALAGQVILGDSAANLPTLLKKPISRVITSPPYPNRFSYVHTTRPQLFFMELIHDATTATEIDLRAVGGTWGRATSNLMNTEVKPYSALEDILSFRRELFSSHPLLCNYAVRYFNQMFEHLRQLKKVVSPNFRGAYVVGNSRLDGVEIHTEVLLAKIFKRIGFKVDEILLFRKRGGKKQLYESAVCVRH